ncbi:response regulator [Sphingobacterium sp. lm-10]|uniref:response regulator n=1 Tax=Sphingobacterium sp. lm-10 TaxID=2944904 RepID=UPI00202012C5|nr:response regulator [Sphingobacterium sp. lm-10]MCL7987020.1 response regulator [Sphingobacterium sp. lm-10]
MVANKKKIIICDDDHGIVNMLEMLLEYTGEYMVESETDSLKIHERLLSGQQDLLLVDLWMPVVSGDQVIRRIRETKELEGLPIIAISASPNGEKIALAAGANAFLAKPFDMDVMLRELHDSLKNSN